jgi:predicted nucleotidyltransferase
MPTALELTPEGWAPYLKQSSRRQTPSTLTEIEQRERDRLLARVREAAKALKKRYMLRRVVLFGSLAHAAWYMHDSDVDLAVEGLAAKDYWQAWKLVEEIIQVRPVDLIEIELVSDSLRRSIERHGIEM